MPFFKRRKKPQPSSDRSGWPRRDEDLAAYLRSLGEPTERDAYTPPPYAEGLVATHVLELPSDLRCPRMAMYLGEEPTDVEAVVPADLRFALLEVPRAQQELLGHRLITTRISFARQPVRRQMPLQAADLAFGNWTKSLLSEEEWAAREQGLASAIENLIVEPVTVVAVSRIIPIEKWPADLEGQDKALDDAVDTCLTFLNEFVLSVGLVTSDPRIRPVARGELPFMCPVIIDAFPMQELRRIGTTFLRQIHRWPPSINPFSDELTRGEAEAAGLLTYLNRQNQLPFFLFYELMHSAFAALEERRSAEAVIFSGTAAEVLIDTVVREASAAFDESDDRRAGVLQAPFANRVRDHLGRYLGGGVVDLEDEQTPFGRWWAKAYALRNRVVHGGHKPTADEAGEAYDAVSALTVEIRDALRANPATAELGAKLEWGRSSERVGFDELLADGTGLFPDSLFDGTA